MASTEFSANLQKLRRAWGLSQTEMGEKFGVSASSYDRWENGTQPDYETLVSIRNFFKISLDSLLNKKLEPADIPPRWGGMPNESPESTLFNSGKLTRDFIEAVSNAKTTMETNQKSNIGRKLLELKNIIVQQFKKSDWIELGYLLEYQDYINKHPRLLKSLDFQDDDYEGIVLQVLDKLTQIAPENLAIIEGFISKKDMNTSSGEFISTSFVEPPERIIQFSPDVFKIPNKPQNERLVSVMMPFATELRPTYQSIQNVCSKLGIECKRADDIWENTTVIQDIFELIFTSKVVIADFTGKNPNVFYEVGIAHTLGKTVIPLTQSIEDVPFDLRHHRVLTYLKNQQGLEQMESDIEKRLSTLFPKKPLW